MCGALLTDAELDHTVGLLLREAIGLRVFGSVPALRCDFPIRDVLGSYGGESR